MTSPDTPPCAVTMQALRHSFLVVNSKWKLPIIVALRAGTRHFRGLERSVAGISTKVLAKELKRRTAKTIELKSLNPEHEDRIFSAEQVAWVARIMWSSQ